MILRLLSAITAAIFLALPGCPSKPVSPAIPQSAPDIQVVTLPSATVGQPYAFQLTAKGGKPPLIWSVISGALPPGLGLLQSGWIKGIPLFAGKFFATVQVKDAKQLADKASIEFNPSETSDEDFDPSTPRLLRSAWQKALPCRKVLGPKHSETITPGNAGCGGGEISGPVTIVIGPPPSVAPTIISVSPAFGSTAGGTAETITGTNFQAGALGTFDTSLCTSPVTVSSTTLTCNTPAHAAAIVDVSITNPDGGTATLPESYTFEPCTGPCVAPAPDISSINPTSGSTAGGDIVNIRGHNFRASASVSFGGSSAVVNSVSYNLISVVTPAHAAGAASVVVTNTDATSATCTGCFTFVAGSPSVSGNVLFGNGWNVFSHPFPGAQGQNAGAVRTWDAGLAWDQIETSNGNFNFTLFDKWLGAAQIHSAKILFTMGHTPSWANGGAGSCPHHTNWACTPPSDIGSGDNFWKGFVTGVKNHVTSWNSTHSPHVTVDFEVWNEPDGGFWSGTKAQLLTLQVDAYNILHPAGYLTGTPAPQGNSLDTYLGGYLSQSGACANADFVDYHPYLKAPVETSVPTMVQKVKAIMAAHGCGSLPLRGTEFAWPGISTSSLCDQTMQAAIMARHHLLQWSNGVAELYWYQWDNTVNGTMWSLASGSCGAPAGTHQDGTAWGTLMVWLPSGSTATGAAKVDSSGNWLLAVTRPGKPNALIGWHPGGSHSFTPPSPYTADWYDFQNTKHSGAASSLNDNPILMESGTVPCTTLLSVAVTPANSTIDNGQTLQFTATGTYNGSCTQNITSSVTWASTAPGVATIASGGLATSVGLGTTVISASLSGINGATNLTVQAPTCTTLSSITVSPASPSILVGATLQFAAHGAYVGGCTQDITGSVTWASGTPANATISGGGLATGVAAGTSLISATSGVIVGSTTLTVNAIAGPKISAAQFGIHINSVAQHGWPVSTIPFGTFRTLGAVTNWSQLLLGNPELSTGCNTAAKAATDPTNACYTWTNFDRVMKAGIDHGVVLEYPLYFTPTFFAMNLNGATGSINDPPNDLACDGTGTDQHFKNFLQAVANHVLPNGQKAYQAIKYWEIWNEPTVNNEYSPHPGLPAGYGVCDSGHGGNADNKDQYRLLHRMGHDAKIALKALNSSIQIVSPPPACCHAAWLGDYFGVAVSGIPGTGADDLDVVAWHDYPASGNGPEQYDADTAAIKAAMVTAGISSLPIWVDEGSWNVNDDLSLTKAQMAAIVARRFILRLAQGNDRAIYYGWDFTNHTEPPSGAGWLIDFSNSFGCTSAITVPSGAAYLCPAATAWTAVTGWLIGSTYPVCSVSAGLYTCTLTLGTGAAARIVWNPTGTTSYTPPGGTTQYKDLLNVTHSYSGGAVSVGFSPLLFKP